MNTAILSRSAIGPFGASSLRAHLSPLRRRVRTTARVSTNPAPLESLTPAASVLTGRWWDPHLLDRLQTPLTRYRE